MGRNIVFLLRIKAFYKRVIQNMFVFENLGNKKPSSWTSTLSDQKFRFYFIWWISIPFSLFYSKTWSYLVTFLGPPKYVMNVASRKRPSSFRRRSSLGQRTKLFIFFFSIFVQNSKEAAANLGSFFLRLPTCKLNNQSYCI